jgi:integrase
MSAFIVDPQELKPGLIIFRRSDVKHGKWYCRVKVPQENRYKTVSLKTANIGEARDMAFDLDADIRFRKKHDVPIFDKSFADVAKEYLNRLKQSVEAEDMTDTLYKLKKSIIDRYLIPYVGNVQITAVGDDKWRGYPGWRKQNGKALGGEGPPKDGTIRKEQIEFRGIMRYAAEKSYIRENQVPKGKIQKGTSRREAFSPEEYRHLHTFARSWIKKAPGKIAEWYRTIVYNFVLVMANTGMRPTEAKNLRWRDVDVRQDRQGRSFVVLSVSGKGKYRELVAASNVATYLDRIREISKAKEPDDFVFTMWEGQSTEEIYSRTIAELLSDAQLLIAPGGTRRCAYCFRHTYATFRLMEGVDVYFLAKQMGTSVKMIEEHYGHITPSKNAERILEGVPEWQLPGGASEPVAAVVNDGEAAAPPRSKPGKKAAPRQAA